jgi:hypothetical protein
MTSAGRDWLLLPDNLGHALVKDRHACHLVEGVVPPRDAPQVGGTPSKWTSASTSSPARTPVPGRLEAR